MSKYSELARELSRNVEGKSDTLRVATLAGRYPCVKLGKPVVDLNLGMRASYTITESVLGSKNCVALEKKLKEELSYYETMLRIAEEGLSNKIIKLADEKTQLEKRRVPSSGIVSKIKNWILGGRIRLKGHTVNSNENYYTSRGHLDEVVKEYLKAANRTVAPYAGWYNFQIPKLIQKLLAKSFCQFRRLPKFWVKKSKS